MSSDQALPHLLTPRPAATVALLRDGASGMEVLLLQRTLAAVFLPGFYVFPGGAVDKHDHDLRLAEFVKGQDESTLNRQLGIASGGLAFLLAAVRECFEESGMLLTCEALSHAHPVMQSRALMARGELSLLDVCRQHRLTLDLGQIAYLDHWITPPGPPRRFDTRFFVAKAPMGQIALHDQHETIDSVWRTPGEAMEAFYQGRQPLIMPTLAVLQKLMPFTTADAAIRHFRSDPVGT